MAWILRPPAHEPEPKGRASSIALRQECPRRPRGAGRPGRAGTIRHRTRCSANTLSLSSRPCGAAQVPDGLPSARHSGKVYRRGGGLEPDAWQHPRTLTQYGLCRGAPGQSPTTGGFANGRDAASPNADGAGLQPSPSFCPSVWILTVPSTAAVRATIPAARITIVLLSRAQIPPIRNPRPTAALDTPRKVAETRP